MDNQARPNAYNQPMKAKAIIKYVPTIPPAQLAKTELQYYQDLSRMIHRDNVLAGWWDAWPEKHFRLATAGALIISELSEALEGCRKGLKDDHLPQHDMFDVELADAMIRLLDLMGGLRYNIPSGMIHRINYQLADWNKPRGANVMSTQVEMIWDTMGYVTSQQWPKAIAGIVAMAVWFNVPLWQIVAEKRVYNLTRADHKPENRAKPGGKKI